MPTSLLDSQFATLEDPTQHPEESPRTIPVSILSSLLFLSFFSSLSFFSCILFFLPPSLAIGIPRRPPRNILKRALELSVSVSLVSPLLYFLSFFPTFSFFSRNSISSKTSQRPWRALEPSPLVESYFYYIFFFLFLYFFLFVILCDRWKPNTTESTFAPVPSPSSPILSLSSHTLSSFSSSHLNSLPRREHCTMNIILLHSSSLRIYSTILLPRSLLFSSLLFSSLLFSSLLFSSLLFSSILSSHKM